MGSGRTKVSVCIGPSMEMPRTGSCQVEAAPATVELNRDAAFVNAAGLRGVPHREQHLLSRCKLKPADGIAGVCTSVNGASGGSIATSFTGSAHTFFSSERFANRARRPDRIEAQGGEESSMHPAESSADSGMLRSGRSGFDTRSFSAPVTIRPADSGVPCETALSLELGHRAG